MALSLKPGVVLTGLRTEMAIAAQVVADVYAELGADCVITSALDSTHSANSLHYVGAALDFRTSVLSAEDQGSLVETVKERLGEDFDVVLETDHLHIEHDVEQPVDEMGAVA